MDMKDLAREFANDTLVIDHLQNEVRGIKVQTKIIIGNNLPHLAPNSRRTGEVIATGPFIVGEEHWTVFNGDLDAVLFRKLDNWRPDLGIVFQILRDSLVLV